MIKISLVQQEATSQTATACSVRYKAAGLQDSAHPQV